MYEWDYSRQLLHLRTSEATGRAAEVDEKTLEDELYGERFLVRRPLLKAIDHKKELPPVLTTQYLEEADQLAHEIAIIDAGRIVRQGIPKELKENMIWCNKQYEKYLDSQE